MSTSNPLHLLRELKGAPLSIVLALSIVHQRVTHAFLVQVTGYTDKPITAALAYLREVGYIDHTSAGWQLSGQARQLAFPLELEPETEQSRNNSDSDPAVIEESRNNSDFPFWDKVMQQIQDLSEWNIWRRYLQGMQLTEILDDQVIISTPDEQQRTWLEHHYKSYLARVFQIHPELAGKSIVFVSEYRNNSEPEESQLNLIVNDFKLTESELIDSPEPDGEIPTYTLPQIRRILDAAQDLLGYPIQGDPTRYRDGDRLLAWIAHAHHYRDRIDNPASLIAWAFKHNRNPDAKYLQHPTRYLPDHFKRSIGI